MATVTIAISGSGGAGAISTGEMLLTAAGRRGYYGMLKKTFSPQIRGGEAAAILRLGTTPVATFTDSIDVLLVLDWQNFARFADEVPVSPQTLVIQNSEAGEPPQPLSDHINTIILDAAGIAAGCDSEWVNMVFLGLMSAALDCAANTTEAVVSGRLAKHGQAAQQSALRALGAGRAQAIPDQLCRVLADIGRVTASDCPRLLASGNQMAALGALEAGVRFVAAYPITPASDLLEYLARHIEAMGGNLVQAEDELAAINMVIGAGYGGVPALTATSGPGLALMVEAMGLAVASETPTVVIDVMRGGPSTGIPTKSEQSDFNLAVHGLHGDAPHPVLACNSIADCQGTTAWAVALASELQTLAIVLSDQFLGQSLQIMASPPIAPAISPPLRANTEETPFQRYLDTPNGVSPMAVPGDSGHMFTADGLEHKQNAIPSPMAGEHQRQLDKRLRKLSDHEFGPLWADIHGDPIGKPLLLCWGSITGSALEARAHWQAQGRDLAVVSLRLLAPLQTAQLKPLLAAASRILVVEQNHGAQFLHYLRGELPEFTFGSLARPGPTLITAGDILAALES